MSYQNGHITKRIPVKPGKILRILGIKSRPKKITFVFEVLTWVYTADVVKVQISELGNVDRDAFTRAALWSAAKVGYLFRDRGRRFKYGLDDVDFWIRKMNQETLNEISQTMLESEIGGDRIIDIYKNATSGEGRTEKKQ